MAAADLIPIIAPELAGNTSLSDAITMVEGEVAAAHPYRDRVIANMAAHVLTLASRGGAGGVVTGETEGSLSRSFGAMDGATRLDSTAYGQEAMRLNRLAYGMTARTA